MSFTTSGVDSGVLVGSEATKEQQNPPTEFCIACKSPVVKKLLCPECLKYNVSSVYCSQQCFRKAWPLHKKFHGELAGLFSSEPSEIFGHQTLKAGFDPSNPNTWKSDKHLRAFLDFRFTGPLRPWPRTESCSVPASIPKPDYYLTGDPVGESSHRFQRDVVCHTPEQIERLRRCCRLARQALDVGHAMIRPGVTPDDIDRAIHEFIILNNGYPSPLNYRGFPKSCCISVNEVICHGIPDLRPLQNGDIVNIDVTVYFEGMHGDLDETYCVGDVDAKGKQLIRAAYDSMMAAIEECRPGVMYRRIGHIISKVVEPQGLSVVRTYCGHGIGELFHTKPNVPHFRKNKAIGFMQPGHVFTIEPMINEGVFHDVTWPDEWTSVTADGKRSAQFEHTLLITEDGVEILTARLPTSPPLEIMQDPESS